MGTKFKVRTGCASLLYLDRIFSEADPHMIRKFHKLFQYNFTIEHISGKSNVVADFLSRHLQLKDAEQNQLNPSVESEHLGTQRTLLTDSPPGASSPSTPAPSWSQFTLYTCSFLEPDHPLQSTPAPSLSQFTLYTCSLLEPVHPLHLLPPGAIHPLHLLPPGASSPNTPAPSWSQLTGLYTCSRYFYKRCQSDKTGS